MTFIHTCGGETAGRHTFEPDVVVRARYEAKHAETAGKEWTNNICRVKGTGDKMLSYIERASCVAAAAVNATCKGHSSSCQVEKRQDIVRLSHYTKQVVLLMLATTTWVR